MSSKKKGKKTKAPTVALTVFLASNGGIPAVPLKSTNWADDVEDEYEGAYSSRSAKEPIVLPTAPRAARGPADDDDSIPMSPPFVAYVSNLPYDVVEEDLTEFFADMQVSNVRLPKDSTKARGYGYVEFEDRASLIEALNLSNSMIKTRRVRIDVSNSTNDERRDGRGGRMGMGRDNRRDYGEDSERTSGDWRSRPREELPEREERFRSRGFDRSEGSSEADNKPGAWREGERPAFSDRRPERRGFRDDDRRGFRDDDRRGFRDDDRRGFRDDDRRGFRDDDRRGFRDDDRRGFRDDDRKESQDWREGQSSGGGFGPRRGGDRETVKEDREASSEPRTRPTLNLLPRTRPIEAIVVKEEPESVKEEPREVKEVKEESKEPKPNIFGAAKPVDTAAREREIEERLAKNQVEKPKKEADEETTKPAAWTRRNGEGARAEREKDKPKASWRSEEDRGRQTDRRQAPRTHVRGDHRGDSRGPPTTRSGAGGNRPGAGKYEARGPPERERRERERRDSKDEPPMPKATDEQAPNFVASNKYSMLNEDDTDVILD